MFTRFSFRNFSFGLPMPVLLARPAAYGVSFSQRIQ
jgi:hypothetical protein